MSLWELISAFPPVLSLFTVCCLSLSFALRLSTSPVISSATHNGLHFASSHCFLPPSPRWLSSLSQCSQVWYVPRRKVGRTFQQHILSSGIGKQWLLSSPHFLSWETCSFSSYYFFFPPEYHQWCVFTFSRPKYQFNDSFCRIYKDMGDWRISFHFLPQVSVIWKLVMYFWPGFLLFFCEYLLTKNVLSMISSSLSINHSCGFSANSSFINLDFHLHLKHFLFTWKFLDALSLSCLLYFSVTLPPASENPHGQSQSWD